MFKVTEHVCSHACIKPRELTDLSWEEISTLKLQVREVYYAKQATLKAQKKATAPSFPLHKFVVEPTNKPLEIAIGVPVFIPQDMPEQTQPEQNDNLEEI